MVCLGNICRSPLADGLLRKKVAEHDLPVHVDSAGTSGHHAGEAPDERMQRTALSHDLSIAALRSRQFTQKDFDEFDLIYVMDKSNYNNVLKLSRSKEDTEKVKLILNESHPNQELEVPDPYFGGDAGFEEVYQLLDNATDVIIKQLKLQ